MKKNDIQDLKTKNVDELKRILSDFQGEISKLSVDKSLGKLKNTNQIKNKKKDVARVLTFLSIKSSVAAVVKGNKEVKNG